MFTVRSDLLLKFDNWSFLPPDESTYQVKRWAIVFIDMRRCGDNIQHQH